MNTKLTAHLHKDEVLEAAAQIAPDYGLPISDVAELIDEASAGDLTAELSSEATAKRAEELHKILSDIVPGLKRLQRLTWDDILSTRSLPTLGVSLLALAMVNGSDVVRLANFGRTLEEAATFLGDMEPRNNTVDPRNAVILAKMVPATLYWLDFDEPAAFGTIIDTFEGPLPTEGSGLEFVARVVLAANDELIFADLIPSFEVLRANLDLDRERELPAVTQLRIVK